MRVMLAEAGVRGDGSGGGSNGGSNGGDGDDGGGDDGNGGETRPSTQKSHVIWSP